MFFFPITVKSRETRRVAKKLYAKIVERSRQPVFYAELMVPDTFTGRFEMITLHISLVINRLQKEESCARLAQSIFDEMFLNMDISCRQSGIGDLGVPKQIKKMMAALKGRALIYEDASRMGDKFLAAALNKNLYATVEMPAENISMAVAHYIMACQEKLNQQSITDFMNSQISFAELPHLNGAYNGQNSQVA